MRNISHDFDLLSQNYASLSHNFGLVSYHSSWVIFNSTTQKLFVFRAEIGFHRIGVNSVSIIRRRCFHCKLQIKSWKLSLSSVESYKFNILIGKKGNFRGSTMWLCVYIYRRLQIILSVLHLKLDFLSHLCDSYICGDNKHCMVTHHIYIDI